MRDRNFAETAVVEYDIYEYINEAESLSFQSHL